MKTVGSFVRVVCVVLVAVALSGCASIHNDPHQPAARRERFGAPAGSRAREHQLRGRSADRAVVLRRRHAGGGVLAWRADRDGRCAHAPRQRVAARSRRLRVRRLWRLCHGGLLRPEEARGAHRLPRALPAARCRGGVADEGHAHQYPRALSGGVNDATGFTRWLDENLFEGATFAEFRADRRPRIWINAADIYNRTTFVFGQTAFSAMCSDLKSYPIADAVAASAAVPVVFAPVVIRTYSGACNRQAAGLDRARAQQSCAVADAQVVRDRYRQVPRWIDALCQASRWRAGRQLWAFRIHDRAALIRHAVWSADAAAGGEAASYPHDGRRCRARSVGQLDPAGRGPVGTGTRGGGGRHRDRCERTRELHRLRPYHGGMAVGAGALALRAFGRGAPASRCTCGLGLPRREGVRHPRWLRSVGTGARRGARCSADELPPAGRRRSTP